jgi:hypothetical protein
VDPIVWTKNARFLATLSPVFLACHFSRLASPNPTRYFRLAG